MEVSALAGIPCTSNGMLLSEELERLMFTSHLLPSPLSTHLLNLAALTSTGYLLNLDFTQDVLTMDPPSLILISPVLYFSKSPQTFWRVAGTLPLFPIQV